MFAEESTTRMRRLSKFSAILLCVKYAMGGIACDTTEFCQQELLTPGVSVCENGFCTNPFEQGCLKAMSEKYGKKNLTWIKNENFFDKIRICNSDDYKTDLKNNSKNSNVVQGCRKADWANYFDMGEIRIGSNVIDSSYMLGFILQILLTELLEVPTTIEHLVDNVTGTGSFYEREQFSTQSYSSLIGGNESDALRTAFDIGDCRKTDKPCAHVLPDMCQIVLDDLDLKGKITKPWFLR